jgi:hypothetical protein
MTQERWRVLSVGALLMLAVVLAACETNPAATPVVGAVTQTGPAIQRDLAVPELPFDDNPDPSQCGIPVEWGKDDPAWLSGYYGGELVQPVVFLYDSHLRYSIKGQAASGTAVRVVLYQQNPALDYYLVETIDQEPRQEGWVPAPFLQFEPLP